MEKSLDCEYCSKTFTNISHLNRHQKNAKYCLEKYNESLVNGRKCDGCLKEYTCLQSYNRHLEICKVLNLKLLENARNDSQTKDAIIQEKDIKIHVLEGKVELLQALLSEFTKSIENRTFLKLLEKDYLNRSADTLGVCFVFLQLNDFIISEKDGGLDNLKVVCKPCNTSCGTMNLLKFKEITYPSCQVCDDEVQFIIEYDSDENI